MLADDADDVIFVVDHRHVSQVVINHFFQCHGDRFCGLDAAHRETHRVAQGNVVGLRVFFEQTRNVAFSQDAIRFATFGNNEVIDTVADHFGQRFTERCLRRQYGNSPLHYGFQRAQLAEYGQAERQAKIGFADHAECFPRLVNDDEVADIVATDQLPGAEQVQFRGRCDEWFRHDGRDRCFRRQPCVQRAQDVGFGNDTQRFIVIADQQA